MQGISFAGIVESLRSRKDKTIAITIGSQEVDPDKAGKLFNTNGHLVYCYLSVKGAVTDNEAEIIDSVEPQVPGKRPSQRMRAILYRMWEQDNQGYTDHNLHYIHWMDKMCEQLKGKLKP